MRKEDKEKLKIVKEIFEIFKESKRKKFFGLGRIIFNFGKIDASFRLIEYFAKLSLNELKEELKKEKRITEFKNGRE